MTEEKHTLAMDGAQFFGEMTASISHEIKNVLAIINENAGLLEDMVAMNRQGASFSAERLEKLAQSVSRQIIRADGIIKTMNRFAHSADHAREPVDVVEAVQFMAQLVSRLVMMQGVRFDIPKPEKAVIVSTSPFFLEYLVWRCMVVAMAARSSETPIRILTETTANGPCLRFTGMAPGEKFSVSSIASLEEGGALELLGARLVLHPEMGEFHVLLPNQRS
ncbi:MAG: hypothetical protein JJV98_09475 [Desulfosarcina sp.]|nr:hypothetical protein [Desulfobacterales bacterium]